MKKAILSVVVLAVLALAAGVYYVYTNLDSIVAAAIEKYGSEAVQTPVRVGSVGVELTQGRGRINALTVANPEGFDAPNAFSLGTIGLDIDVANTGRQVVVIDEIDIRAPEVFYILNQDRQDNLRILKNNLDTGAPAERPREDKAGDGLRLLIRKVVFSEGALHANIMPLDRSYDMELPQIRMHDLGAPNGAPPSAIARQIVSGLLEQARGELRSRGLDGLQQEVESGKQELQERAREKLRDKKDRAQEKLKELRGN